MNADLKEDVLNRRQGQLGFPNEQVISFNSPQKVYLASITLRQERKEDERIIMERKEERVRKIRSRK